MVLQAILLIDVSDDLTPQESNEILEYIPVAVMRYSGCLEADHPARKIIEADIPAVILPRPCADCDHEECHEGESKEKGCTH